MPELPEVETVVRDLRPRAVGRAVAAVRCGTRRLRTPWDAAWNAALVGCRVEALRRRGKWIAIELTRRAERREPPGDATRGLTALGSPALLVHLGMTGQFTAVPAGEPEPDHLHLVFALDDGTELRFRDVRRFGSATLFPDAAAVEAHFAEAGLGPEPFGVDPDYFRDAVRKSARSLKAILLDQRVLAGVGNIYADEACFRAGLDPRRTGTSLSPAEADRLRAAVEAVLARAVERRGSTIRDYVGGSGLRGGFQHEHAVYGRTGEPCRACATPIAWARLAGRSSHYCPTCQPSSPQRSRRTRRKTEIG
ncbi:MAG: bifunctional DNA-formamidopyrimidine glycosylase/DNA-(apurinic or apyrimidinic site) lyase [Gemmataceae bacterium]|nr:bifunctional DNA-formamidopyrimidine glycosylase/DNA-(apurinic or apyrimidinic site) lyase [Gemmataceae bacterium]